MTSRLEPVTFVAGLVTLSLGTLLWLQDSGSIDMTPGWMAAVACLAIGTVLIASGLASRRR